jgi:riboflavin biosynthesis pyrimidine reductase
MLNVRRVAGRHPARVVIDPSGRLPASAKCLEADGVRRIVIQGRDGAVPDGVERIVIARENGLVAPSRIVAELFARGLKRLLIEGGATTISAFIEAGMVDRLHVLVAPMILGSGKTGLNLAPISSLGAALRPTTTVDVLSDGDVLFDCDLRSCWKGV